jgi:hypothetical protein
MIGLRLGGTLMAILAIPTVLAIRLILAHIQLNKNFFQKSTKKPA